MGKEHLQDIEKIDIVNLYINGSSIKDLSIKYNRAESSLRDLIKRRGINLRQCSELNRKYKINEDYFDIINDSDKAYFLGFLYADGTIKKTSNTISLRIKESDSEILNKLNKLIYPEKELTYENDTRKNREKMATLSIYSKRIKRKLIEFGCTPNKTHTLNFPEWLEDELIPSFIRGYFDGDGYIGLIPDSRKKTNGDSVNCINYKFTLTGNYKFLKQISKILNTKLKINSSFDIRHKTTPNIVTLTISGGNQIERLFDYLYKDGELFMNRKYLKFKEVKNRRKKFSIEQLKSME